MLRVYYSLYTFICTFGEMVKPHRRRKQSNLDGQLARIIETDNGIIKTREMRNLLRRTVSVYMNRGDISRQKIVNNAPTVLYIDNTL